MLTIAMAMQTTLIQTAAMSVADIGEGPNILRPNWGPEGPKKFLVERAGISAIKFEAARIHFLSDVLVAVATVVA